VRPGKTQPVCDCHETCAKHGRNKVVYHDRGEFPMMSGYFCADCETERVYSEVRDKRRGSSKGTE